MCQMVKITLQMLYNGMNASFKITKRVSCMSLYMLHSVVTVGYEIKGMDTKTAMLLNASWFT